MTVFMSLILILQRFTEMGLLSIFKAHSLVKRTMGLWNDCVVMCIKIYNFKGSKNMTVFMSLILILRRFTEMGLLSKYDLFMSLILILRRFTEMDLISIFKSP